MTVPDISVVIPVYRNAPTLKALNDRLNRLFASSDLSHEIIYVEDASPDDSLAVLERIAQQDRHVAVISLVENEGQQGALLTGLSHARGDRIVTMDADLQDLPEAISELMVKQAEGFDVVFAGRRGHYTSWLQYLTSWIFKALLHMLCGIPSDAGLFLIMNRELKQQLSEMNPARPYILGMIGCTGATMTSIAVKRAPRPIGESAYTVFKRLQLAYYGLSMVLIYKFGMRGTMPSLLSRVFNIKKRHGNY